MANSRASFPLVLLTALFFMWGFLTCLNDILIPQLKSVFILNYTQIMLIQLCFFSAYFFVSIPSGQIIRRVGYQKGIVGGLGIAGIGCLLFYPAAKLISYPIFLSAFFILASGITLLQVAANPFVTLLGDPATAASRLNLTQAFNSLGTTLAPFFGSWAILTYPVKTHEELNQLAPEAFSTYQQLQAASVQGPYLFLAASLLTLAILFTLIKLPSIQIAASRVNKATSSSYPKHLKMGVIAIFLYVGAEVSIGSFLIAYLSQKEISGLSANEAASLVSFYWGGAMVGRFFGASLMQKIPASRLLTIHAILAILLLIIVIFARGPIAMFAILAIGMCNSIMFPSIFSLSLVNLAERSAQASGFLCTAIVGGAIIPLIQGICADNLGIYYAFFIPLLCYSYIAYFGMWGSCSKIS